MEPPRGARQNGYAHSTSMVHPSAVVVGPSRHKAADFTRNKPEFRTQRSHMPQPPPTESSFSSTKKNDIVPAKESGMVNKYFFFLPLSDFYESV